MGMVYLGDSRLESVMRLKPACWLGHQSFEGLFGACKSTSKVVAHSYGELVLVSWRKSSISPHASLSTGCLNALITWPPSPEWTIHVNKQKLQWLLWLSMEVLHFPSGSDGKDSACNAGNAGDWGSIPGGEDPLEKEWQPTPIFLPGEFLGQRSLAVYHSWGYKELDTAEWLIQLYCWKSHVIIFFFSIRSTTGYWI